MKKSREIDRYIDSAPAWAREMLREIRKTIRAAAPKAQEKISYHMPYFGYHGRLAYFAAFKEHTSFFWVSAADKKNFKKKLAAQQIVGSTLRIPRGARPPLSLIRQIVQARIKKNVQKVLGQGFKICSRGHKYKGKGCPVCWSGYRRETS